MWFFFPDELPFYTEHVAGLDTLLVDLREETRARWREVVDAEKEEAEEVKELKEGVEELEGKAEMVAAMAGRAQAYVDYK